MEVSGVSCETESPGLRRSKNIQINSSRLPPMMAANVVQHKMRLLCAPPEIRTHIHFSSTQLVNTYSLEQKFIRIIRNVVDEI